MFIISRRSMGFGLAILGGMTMPGAEARPDHLPQPLTRQLSDLGAQAVAQGRPEEARNFYRNALKLDPNNAEARAALGRLGTARLASQASPGMLRPGSGEAPGATPLERQSQLNTIAREAFVADIRQRLQAARELSNARNPDGALNTLRNALRAIAP